MSSAIGNSSHQEYNGQEIAKKEPVADKQLYIVIPKVGKKISTTENKSESSSVSRVNKFVKANIDIMESKELKGFQQLKKFQGNNTSFLSMFKEAIKTKISLYAPSCLGLTTDKEKMNEMHELTTNKLLTLCKNDLKIDAAEVISLYEEINQLKQALAEKEDSLISIGSLDAIFHPENNDKNLELITKSKTDQIKMSPELQKLSEQISEKEEALSAVLKDSKQDITLLLREAAPKATDSVGISRAKARFAAENKDLLAALKTTSKLTYSNEAEIVMYDRKTDSGVGLKGQINANAAILNMKEQKGSGWSPRSENDANSIKSQVESFLQSEGKTLKSTPRMFSDLGKLASIRDTQLEVATKNEFKALAGNRKILTKNMDACMNVFGNIISELSVDSIRTPKELSNAWKSEIQNNNVKEEFVTREEFNLLSRRTGISGVPLSISNAPEYKELIASIKNGTWDEDTEKKLTQTEIDKSELPEVLAFIDEFFAQAETNEILSKYLDQYK